MEAQHTSGPWRATPGNSQMSDPGTTIYHRGQWGVYSDADAHGDHEADARLIAAAPELLKVAQAYMVAFERHCITNTHGARDFDFSGDIARLASAAIAKATQ